MKQELPDIETPWSTVGYITAKRCVDVNAPVLCADLTWRKAGELIEGDEIYVFDDDLVLTTTQKNRYIRLGHVTHNKIETARCLGIVLEDGEVMYCTPDHKWLVSTDAQNGLFWREAKDLQETKKHTDIYLPRLFGKVWEREDSYISGYLGGAYDGEGCLDRTNSVQFMQVGNSMLSRVEQYLADMGYSNVKKTLRNNNSSVEYKSPRQDCYALRISGFKNIVRLLGITGSSRLTDKLRSNILKKPQRMRCAPEDYVKVVDVFDAGERDIAVMSTSHGTHFTYGFPSHNTYCRRIEAGNPESPTEEWRDVVERVVTACDTQLGVGFTPEEETRLAGYMLALKGTVAGRFLWQLGTPTVERLGLLSLQNCFSGSTEIMTDKGLRRLESVGADEEIKVLFENKWYPAGVKCFGVQDLYTVEYTPFSKARNTLKMEVTEDHKWMLASGEVTTSLKVGDRIKVHAFEPQHNPDAFIHGLVFGDGSVHYRYKNGDYGHMVRLCGKKERFKHLFEKFHYQPNCNGDPVAYHRSPVCFKALPEEGSDPAYIASFIAGWLAADGSLDEHGGVTISSQNYEAMCWLQRHAKYAGYQASTMSEWSRESNFGSRSAPLIRILLKAGETYATVKSISPLKKDLVYCAVVPGIGFFTLANGLTTGNCAATVVDEPVRPFTWAMDALMLGSGVGFNIQREYVYKLPKVRSDFVPPVRKDSSDADFIVPDTREGWVKLLEYTLRSAFYEGDKRGFSYSTQLIRGKGAPIKGFGGTASGPEDLVWGIGEIAKVIHARRDKQLRPIDCLDIMNIIGAVVVAGNVRRSAQIAIGDPDDIQYLKAKNWSDGNIPNWRANSNNSIVCNDVTKLPVEFWETYNGKSEPYGLINLKLSRSCGRLGETKYKDKDVVAFNPCAEQSLAAYETCCLAEIWLPNIESYDELVDVAKLLYRVNKHSLALPCHHKETEEIVHKNMRMGIGVTGYLQATEEQREWLKDCYKELRAFDKEYSKAHDWPTSIKLTTVKPSGTLSLLPGVTPGAHGAYAQYMIRRIRISSNHPLVETCKEHGYKVEYQRGFDGAEDRSTVVVEFPFSYPEGTVLADEMSAVDQLKWVRRLQEEWSDNSVSCTVYYRPEEMDEIKAYLKENYNQSIKTVSFLLHSGHGFDQAPFEEITKEQYEEMVRSTRVITKIDQELEMDDDECASGACPIR